VFCLLATDDEAFTYDKRINRLAPIQEHIMIIRAIERGVSEQRIARAWCQCATDSAEAGATSRYLPQGGRAAQDKHISSTAMTQLKKMCAGRQIEAAELMLAADNFTIAYARTARGDDAGSAAELGEPKQISGISAEQMARMEREMANLQRGLKLVEDPYGGDVLNLVLARGYLVKLFSNPAVAKYLHRHQPGDEVPPGDHVCENRGHNRADPLAGLDPVDHARNRHQQVIATTMEPLPLSPSAGGIAWEPTT
jgi:hypothetical protein